MVYNTFAETQNEYQILMRDHPGLITLAIGGARLANNLDTWDDTSIALISRIAKTEWRAIDTIYGLFRDNLGIEGQLSLQRLRQGWRALWLASVRQIAPTLPKRSLVVLHQGNALLDQMEVDFMNTPPILPVDTWIDNARAIILNIRETEVSSL